MFWSRRITDIFGQYVHAFERVAESYGDVTTTFPTSPSVRDFDAVTQVICVKLLTTNEVTATPLNVTEFTE